MHKNIHFESVYTSCKATSAVKSIELHHSLIAKPSQSDHNSPTVYWKLAKQNDIRILVLLPTTTSKTTSLSVTSTFPCHIINVMVLDGHKYLLVNETSDFCLDLELYY